MKHDPIALTLRALVVIIAAIGAIVTISAWPTLPAFAGIAYLMVFAFAGAVGALGI